MRRVGKPCTLHSPTRHPTLAKTLIHIVAELTHAGMSDEWIMKNIGMDKDELLRLKQVSGLAALFTDADFSIPNKEEQTTNRKD